MKTYLRLSIDSSGETYSTCKYVQVYAAEETVVYSSVYVLLRTEIIEILNENNPNRTIYSSNNYM